MKHLRNFSAMHSLLEQSNEGINKDKLKDFVESCLAYLLDEGFEIFIPRGVSDGATAIWLSHSTKGYFNWNDIKDYYIPLLELLSNRYNIIGFGSPSSQVRFRMDGEYAQYKDFPLYSVVNVFIQ